MVSAFNLAGLFTAHSLWCVSDGDQCFPLLAYVDAAGERNMERFGGDAPRSYPQARERLDQNVMGAVDAAFVFPGKIDEQAAQRDAIISEVRSYAHPQARAVVAVPVPASCRRRIAGVQAQAADVGGLSGVQRARCDGLILRWRRPARAGSGHLAASDRDLTPDGRGVPNLPVSFRRFPQVA